MEGAGLARLGSNKYGETLAEKLMFTNTKNSSTGFASYAAELARRENAKGRERGTTNQDPGSKDTISPGRPTLSEDEMKAAFESSGRPQKKSFLSKAGKIGSAVSAVAAAAGLAVVGVAGGAGAIAGAAIGGVAGAVLGALSVPVGNALGALVNQSPSDEVASSAAQGAIAGAAFGAAIGGTALAALFAGSLGAVPVAAAAVGVGTLVVGQVATSLANDRQART